MTIDLSDYERGEPLAGDYSYELKDLQDRLARLQARMIVHGKRAILLLEGWDAAGKGGIVKRLTAGLDPRYFEVFPIAAPTPPERERHFLWRFWRDLPGAGDWSIFDRSWYGRVLVERVEGFASEAEWTRGFDEINEFEASQTDLGTILIKLFVHVTQEEQDRRFIDRLEKPHKRWKITTDDFRNRKKRGDYLAAMHDMFARTDTRWAPWTVVDGNDKKAARIAALTTVADRLDAALPVDFPELDKQVAKAAKKALGWGKNEKGRAEPK
ncbi:polyphosphate kinase 2 family protein [Novosphingopyxis sp. YJ-S2-01]|uniref:polyphosphate kinase 2 family protein n=1 Tax=Novosphingopyxis sp. YJ-S2-01 TaxID=2794021 RepID=UPI0018DE2D5A|nr:polyphosphate kinase [Novosphingopyxis sp. YJ-S2-01]MBH9537296.1 polyphosphate kinase [Novosphingopyxis sp. YJ-S2-01]